MPEHQAMPAARRIPPDRARQQEADMLEWAECNPSVLAGHELFATAMTGRLLQQFGLPVTCLRSSPFGGDQQIGVRIAEGDVDLLVFFWNPLEPHPTTPTSTPCCGSRSSVTSRWPATGQPQTS